MGFIVWVLCCFRVYLNLCVGLWVGDGSWDVARVINRGRDVAHHRVRGVTIRVFDESAEWALVASPNKSPGYK